MSSMCRFKEGWGKERLEDELLLEGPTSRRIKRVTAKGKMKCSIRGEMRQRWGCNTNNYWWNFSKVDMRAVRRNDWWRTMPEKIGMWWWESWPLASSCMRRFTSNLAGFFLDVGERLKWQQWFLFSFNLWLFSCFFVLVFNWSSLYIVCKLMGIVSLLIVFWVGRIANRCVAQREYLF